LEWGSQQAWDKYSTFLQKGLVTASWSGIKKPILTCGALLATINPCGPAKFWI